MMDEQAALEEINSIRKSLFQIQLKSFQNTPIPQLLPDAEAICEQFETLRNYHPDGGLLLPNENQVFTFFLCFFFTNTNFLTKNNVFNSSSKTVH